MDYEIARAQQFLKDILLDTRFKPWQPAGVLIRVGKQSGISRTALRTARKELGVISMGIEGEQYWAFPERIGAVR